MNNEFPVYVWVDAAFRFKCKRDRCGAIGMVALTHTHLINYGFPITQIKNSSQAESLGREFAKLTFPNAIIHNDVLEYEQGRKITNEWQWVSDKDLMLKKAHQLASIAFEKNKIIHLEYKFDPLNE